MKNTIKICLLIVIGSTLFACKNDDNSNTKTQNSIIGEWLRSDYNVDTNFEYKLHFFELENAGMITTKTSSGKGIISNATSFTWSINGNNLTITQDIDGQITTPYLFESNGNRLLLSNFSELEFIKQ